MDSQYERAQSADRPVVIVCAYPDGVLGNSWFRAYRKVKRAGRRRGLAAQFILAPVTDLPTQIDVLMLPPSLAGLAIRVSEVLVASPDDLHQAFLDLADRLIESGRMKEGDSPARTIAVHQGFQPMVDRAEAPPG